MADPAPAWRATSPRNEPALMLNRSPSQSKPGSPAKLIVYVPDGDTVAERGIVTCGLPLAKACRIWDGVRLLKYPA